MQRFSNYQNRLIAGLPAGNFRHLTHSRHSARTTALAQNAVLKEIEARWSKRLREQSAAMHRIFHEIKVARIEYAEVEQAGTFESFEQQIQSFDRQRIAWERCMDGLRQQHEQETKKLALENSYLLDAALGERKARMKLETRYNVGGALEHMVFLAKFQQKVQPTADVQQGLLKLAQSSEFTVILGEEVEARKLDHGRVLASVSHLYREVANRSKGNDDIIIVRANMFNDIERAALVAFLKMQSNWPNPLKWKEDTSCKGGE